MGKIALFSKDSKKMLDNWEDLLDDDADINLGKEGNVYEKEDLTVEVDKPEEVKEVTQEERDRHAAAQEKKKKEKLNKKKYDEPAKELTAEEKMDLEKQIKANNEK